MDSCTSWRNWRKAIDKLLRNITLLRPTPDSREAAVVKALKAMEPPLEHLNDEPVADFERLLQFWDFRYPYSPEVTCPHCGAHTADWRNDPAHPFHLTTANLGGLLVFRCKSCQSTVRQKHFRDHMAVECTPYNPD